MPLEKNLSASCKDLADPHVLKNACLYLMSHYAHHPCITVAHGVVQHLELLLLHPDTRLDQENRNICISTLEKWREIARRHLRETKTAHGLSRTNKICH